MVHYAMWQLAICVQLPMESPWLNRFNVLLIIIELAFKTKVNFAIIQVTKYGAIHI